MSHFERSVIDPDDVELKFIGQCRGWTANDIPIEPTARNVVDGGIQCSTSGPELFVVTPPLHNKNIGSSMEYIEEHQHLPSVFSRGSTSNKSKFCKKCHWKILSTGSENDDVLCWNTPPRVTPNSYHTGLLTNITTHENKPISKELCTSLPPNSKDHLHAPVISSIVNHSSSNSIFFQLNPFHTSQQDPVLDYPGEV